MKEKKSVEYFARKFLWENLKCEFCCNGCGNVGEKNLLNKFTKKKFFKENLKSIFEWLHIKFRKNAFDEENLWKTGILDWRNTDTENLLQM
jgi:hypothetical protein